MWDIGRRARRGEAATPDQRLPMRQAQPPGNLDAGKWAGSAHLLGDRRHQGGVEELGGQIAARFGERGLTVIAVPSPDFGNQEPLDGLAIAEAARKNHGVTFPVTAKTHVRGPAAHPFYRWAAAEKPGNTPSWNFHKYLIDRDGTLIGAFPSNVEPNDPRIVTAVANALPAA